MSVRPGQSETETKLYFSQRNISIINKAEALIWKKGEQNRVEAVYGQGSKIISRMRERRK